MVIFDRVIWPQPNKCYTIFHNVSDLNLIIDNNWHEHDPVAPSMAGISNWNPAKAIEMMEDERWGRFRFETRAPHRVASCRVGIVATEPERNMNLWPVLQLPVFFLQLITIQTMTWAIQSIPMPENLKRNWGFYLDCWQSENGAGVAVLSGRNQQSLPYKPFVQKLGR